VFGEVGAPITRQTRARLVIDGVDQRAFFRGEQDHSNRVGFLFWAQVITATDGMLCPISVISNISTR
jgi:hypothetical protein